jgi:hypothetical protein
MPLSLSRSPQLLQNDKHKDYFSDFYSFLPPANTACEILFPVVVIGIPLDEHAAEFANRHAYVHTIINKLIRPEERQFIKVKVSQVRVSFLRYLSSNLLRPINRS